VATERQTQAMVSMLRHHFPGAMRLLDVGCGDGSCTAELASHLPQTQIVAFDASPKAVERAQTRFADRPLMRFQPGSAYEIENLQAGTFDVAVVRGLLHHLYEPEKAIHSLAKVVDAVLIVEPNGANPIMKAIERFSAYHRAHEEKSYWPPSLNGWFRDSGFTLLEQQFVCLVPYFCPEWMARMLKFSEPLVESVPLVRFVACGTNVAVYRKNA